MKINISQPAFEWLEKDLRLQKGDFVRFFVRLGGCSTIQQGFSLGLTKSSPRKIGISTEIDGVTLFVEETDLWYLDNKDLSIDHLHGEGIVFRTQ